MIRSATSELVLEVGRPALVSLAVAAARLPGLDVRDELSVTVDGRDVGVRELQVEAGGRTHLAEVPAGRLIVRYEAEVRGHADPVPVSDTERVTYLRPSRYAESDRLEAFARSEFAGVDGARDLLVAVSSWVGSRLQYVSGSSRPTDGAVDTLLARRGVCRDYAHLVIALLRACDVPARLVSVYAPGLTPMDFHAVAEAVVDGTWRAVDATLLAPRPALLRIATGRDAADTAFLSNYGGDVELLEIGVSAWTQGDLPADDVTELVSLG